MEEIYRLIHDIYVFMDSGDTQVLSKFGLTQTQYRTLILLDVEIGKSQTILSDELMRNRSTITRLIDQLEERGLVIRQQKPNDRRTLYITLTPEGMIIRRRVRRAHLQSLERRLSVFTAEELEQFEQKLHIFRDSLLEDLETQASNEGGNIEED